MLLVGLLAFAASKILGDGNREKPKWTVAEIQDKASSKADGSSDAASSATGDGSTAEETPPVDLSNETPDERDERAEARLRNFFTATKPEEMFRHVRDPERVAPLIKEFYSRESFAFDSIEFLGLKTELLTYDPAGPKFYVAEADVNSPRSRSMILEDTPKGFRIDWEYFVRYNPMNWATFIKEAPVPPSVDPMDFRVVARIVPDYRGPFFTDRSRYLAVQMLTLDDDSPELIGYAVRSSELGKELEAFLKDQAEQLCILKLEFPGGSKPGDTAVHIRKLVRPHWIITDENSEK